jgi:hypothetical protein
MSNWNEASCLVDSDVSYRNVFFKLTTNIVNDKEFVAMKLKGFPGSTLNRIDVVAVHFFTV